MSTNTSQSSESQSLTRQKIERLELSVRKGWTPPPRISVPQWADDYRKLAKEAGSTSGNWETSTVEIARGPMLAATESGVHIITVMCCTQLMKTALLENLFGYFAHLDPCPILLLQPKEEAAEQFSKERISPLVRVTPVLRKIIGDSKQKSSKETILYKAFTGGFLALAGAGSPDNLARRPIRVLLADEVDKYPITREGDPIALAEERTATFGLTWLSVRACSPTVEDESRIADSYADSDQRRASVVCPHCGHRQFPDFFKHVQWPKEGDKHLTKSAMLYCECCGSGWSEGQRLRALHTIRWHQTRPFECCGERHSPLMDYDLAWRAADEGSVEKVWQWSESERHAVYRAICPSCGKEAVDNHHAGYQASKLFSPWQKDKPSDIAKKYIDAKGDPDKEQAWWNTQMGLPHRPNHGKQLPVDVLLARREIFPAVVPDGVALLTAGVDTQDDRFEITITGWGRDEESWSVAHDVIYGDLETEEPWKRLDAYLKQIWRRGDGRGLNIMATCMDSGGHHTQKVPKFTLNWGESPQEVIDRVARWSALLYYDQPDGNLLLTRVGTRRAASGIAEGVNVEQAYYRKSMADRFSDYVGVSMSVSPIAGYSPDTAYDAVTLATARDPEAARMRYRKHISIVESTLMATQQAQSAIDWEMNRRYGRSKQLSVTIDSWRDKDGKLWEPNTLIPVDLPSLRLPETELLLAEVTYMRDDYGTHARMTLMPPEAFAVQPYAFYQNLAGFNT